MIATTHPDTSVGEPTLYVAFELGQRDWKLAMTSGFGVPPWVRTVASGDLAGVEGAIREGRRRLGVPAMARVMSCYEAGRDGFLIHRALAARAQQSRGGFGEHRGESPGAPRQDRSARRAEVSADAGAGVFRGAARVERSARADVADEAARQVSRERTALTQERTRLVNRLRGWLATWGTRLPRRRAPAGGATCGIGRARLCQVKCKRGWPGPTPGSRVWPRKSGRSARRNSGR